MILSAVRTRHVAAAMKCIAKGYYQVILSADRLNYPERIKSKGYDCSLGTAGIANGTLFTMTSYATERHVHEPSHGIRQRIPLLLRANSC